jgi:hypothetical protein
MLEACCSYFQVCFDASDSPKISFTKNLRHAHTLSAIYL